MQILFALSLKVIIRNCFGLKCREFVATEGNRCHVVNITQRDATKCNFLITIILVVFATREMAIAVHRFNVVKIRLSYTYPMVCHDERTETDCRRSVAEKWTMYV